MAWRQGEAQWNSVTGGFFPESHSFLFFSSFLPLRQVLYGLMYLPTTIRSSSPEKIHYLIYTKV